MYNVTEDMSTDVVAVVAAVESAAAELESVEDEEWEWW